jgi:hypothetical protein
VASTRSILGRPPLPLPTPFARPRARTWPGGSRGHVLRAYARLLSGS